MVKMEKAEYSQKSDSRVVIEKLDNNEKLSSEVYVAAIYEEGTVALFAQVTPSSIPYFIAILTDAISKLADQVEKIPDEELKAALKIKTLLLLNSVN